MSSNCCPETRSPEPSIQGTVYNIAGRVFRVGKLRNEWYDDVTDPAPYIRSLKTGSAPFDVFSFIQRPPASAPKFSFHMVNDHVAAVPITSVDHWLKEQVAKKVRKNIRRSEKDGVIIKIVPFDDSLVSAIQRIYDELPVRGGVPFPHYHEDLATVKRNNGTFLDRSTFIGAFFKGEMIGFIKLVEAGSTARTMQNISLARHRDLSAPNAMLAKAVEICAQKGIAFLVYGKLSYGHKGNDGLEAFKIANGFRRLEFPRYYVPLTSRGKLAIALRLYREVSDWLPKGLVKQIRTIRTNWFSRRNRDAT